MSAAPLDATRGGVIVSSQAMDTSSPLAGTESLVRLALAAELGGAVGFRVDGAETVRALRRRTGLPIIGIVKHPAARSCTYITTQAADVRSLVDAGADIVALQATNTPRPGPTFAELASLARELGAAVMADIATVEEGLAAQDQGADVLGTTLAGYTPQSESAERPAIPLLRELTDVARCPVILEGGVWTPEHVASAFDAGAWAVVVGAAVTAPDLITRRLSQAAHRSTLSALAGRAIATLDGDRT